MHILEQRFLRGPNLHADMPCLLSVIDLDDLYGVPSNTIPGFNDALLALLPSLRGQRLDLGQRVGFAQRLRQGTYMARVVEQVTLELQVLCGASVAYGRTKPVAGRPGQFRIVCAYESEPLAGPAFRLAADLVDALSHEETFSLAPRLDELRGIVARHRVDADTAALLAAAHERGVPVQRISEDADTYQLGWGVRQKRLRATVSDSTRFVAQKLAGNRELARALLAEAGVPVPDGAIAEGEEEALRLARGFGGRVVVKPVDCEDGDGQPADCAVTGSVEAAWAAARAHGRRALVERAAPGELLRVWVAGGRIACAARRGGDEADIAGLLPEATRRLCLRAVAKLGLDMAAVDIVRDERAAEQSARDGLVLDVRAAPPLPAGAREPAAAAIIGSLMAGSNGRIPVIAITGTNGKTTTTLLIAHTVALAGKVAGVTTTEGVFIGGNPTSKGDCTGYWSARAVLAAPDVEFAVLETARGGILKRGLAFDCCEVGVVLNVAPDHLGLDGIDTLEDLAQVKAVVAANASRAVVLNAEDALCVQMVRRLKPSAEVVFFSMEADNPVLLKHLEDGGRGAYVQDNAIVLANGESHQQLIRIESMPVSFGGLARFNIANALAAAAALMAAGFAGMQIVAGLSTFESNGRTNPLRTNVFDVRGVTVIVDYAHNPAAYAAMAGMARAMLPRHLVGIVTAPGDRRDSDLLEVGRVCGERFDELVVYESQSRGRPVGDAVDLILEGAEEVVGPSDTLHRVIEVGEAIRHGMSLCSPGDVLVFACGSSLSVFIDAIRVTDPESADKIALQIA